MAGPASHDHDSDYHRGEMEISEQVSTFHLVMGMTKWGALFIAAGTLFFVGWLNPHGNFMLGFLGALVLILVGVLGLREPKKSGH